MPNNGRSFDLAAEERRALLEQGQERAKKFLSGFLEFAFSENILQFAFGLIIAEGFTRMTNSLVNDIILPPLSALFPLNRNLDEKFAVLKPGPNYDSAMGYTTLRQAIEDGAVVMAYGVFINRVINFIGIGVALYALAKILQEEHQRKGRSPSLSSSARYTSDRSRRPVASTAQAGKMDAKSAWGDACPAIRKFIQIHVETPTAEEPGVVRDTE
ncbi:hypothetical protein DL765_007697 [Monosporascus sp. GIB2]|nr:hypothetical protein DL765_007697 [Monosporascus sp. GIB2]